MFGIDKVYHFLFYGLLAYVLGSIACQLSPRGKSGVRLIWIGIVLLWIGVLDEYRQFLHPSRDTEFLDGVANLAGVSVGLAITFVSHKRLINRVKLRSAVIFPIASLWLFMFLGLHMLTSKGYTHDPFFFLEGHSSDGVSHLGQTKAVVVQIHQEQRGIANLREKYLSQLLYLEDEYREELAPLITYMLSGQGVFHHLWLMKQLEDATNDQLEEIFVDMERTIQLERLPADWLEQIKQECMERKKIMRAKRLKEAIIHWRQQSYGWQP